MAGAAQTFSPMPPMHAAPDCNDTSTVAAVEGGVIKNDGKCVAKKWKRRDGTSTQMKKGDAILVLADKHKRSSPPLLPVLTSADGNNSSTSVEGLGDAMGNGDIAKKWKRYSRANERTKSIDANSALALADEPKTKRAKQNEQHLLLPLSHRPLGHPHVIVKFISRPLRRTGQPKLFWLNAGRRDRINSITSLDWITRLVNLLLGRIGWGSLSWID